MDPFAGDRPWEEGGKDWLGFGPFANRIATSLVKQDAGLGLVVGIEGKWGSGKSSLLNLTISELCAIDGPKRPVIVEFRPWLVGDREALLASLFDELAKAVAGAEYEAGDSTGITVEKAKKIGERLRSFGSYLSIPGKLLTLAGIALPGAGILGEFTTKLAEAAATRSEGPSLAQLKDDLSRELKTLGRPIIVTIDDVDRLEPSEVLELLRLVRAVADFPNVTYLMCYDEKVLAQGITAAAKIKDGKAYLEKIVQLTIAVPLPEPFQLRHWFKAELETFARPPTDDQQQRLISVIDQEGGKRLDTPRHVVRALNAVRLFWPALESQGADLSDLVWLQLIKVANPAYYKWIERYCADSSAVATGKVTIADEGKLRTQDALKKLFKKDEIDFTRELYFLSDILLGIDTFAGHTKGKLALFSELRSGAEQALQGRRLKSPDHFRLYFALTAPSGAPSQADYDKLWKALADGTDSARDLLLEWHEPGSVPGLTKACLVLERIRSASPQVLNSVRSRNLLIALANTLDAAAHQHGLGEFFGPEIWKQAERLVPVLMERISKSDRKKLLEEMYGTGASFGWLISVFRRETFAHGRYGDRRKDEGSWFFTEPELDAVTKFVLNRFAAMTLDEILGLPQPLSAMFAWLQGGGGDRPRKLILPAIRTHKGLVQTLERMTGRVQTSEGEVVTLSRSNVEPFFDYEVTRARIERMAQKKDALSQRAKLLQDAFEAAERF